MVPNADRRSLLRALGGAATVAVAGCNALLDSGDSENPGTTTTAPATSERDAPALTMQAEGTFEWAGSRNTNLAYTTAGETQRVVYGGEDRPVFDSVGLRLVALDGGIAYTASREVDGTTYGYVRVRGTERARVDLDDDGYPLLYEDTVDGEPIWRAGGREAAPGAFYHGSQRIQTDYDLVHSIFEVDGDIGYVGEQEDWEVTRGDIVVDGSVVRSVGVLNYGPKGVAGDPTYLEFTRDGGVLRHGDRDLGSQYTSPDGNSDIRWFGEVAGELAFIARVWEDAIERDGRSSEFILWYDGEEVARHQHISKPDVRAHSMAMTDDGLAYECSEPGTGGVAVEGEVVGEDGTLPVSVDGTLAFVREGDGDTVVLDGRDVAEYRNVESIFELDGDLAVLGYTELGTENDGEIVRVS